MTTARYRYYAIGLRLVRVALFPDGLPEAAEAFDPATGGFAIDNRLLGRIADDGADVQELSAAEFAAETMAARA